MPFLELSLTGVGNRRDLEGFEVRERDSSENHDRGRDLRNKVIENAKNL